MQNPVWKICLPTQNSTRCSSVGGLCCEIHPIPATRFWVLLLCLCSWSNETNQHHRQFFAWVHLLSSQWTPRQAWMLVKLQAQVELISLLAGCHWGMWSLQHHTVDSTALSGLPVFRSLYHYLLLSCFLECVISASTWLMILCMFKCVLTLFHHLDSSVNFTLHRFFSHWQN